MVKNNEIRRFRCFEKKTFDDYIKANPNISGVFELGKFIIDNAPTVEVPENEVNCVLTMFGECSYNKTGCSDCEIKDKIRKSYTEEEVQEIREEVVKEFITISERAQGEWIRTGSLGNGNAHYECSECHYGDEHAESQEVPYCWHCGASMKKGGAKE